MPEEPSKLSKAVPGFCSHVGCTHIPEHKRYSSKIPPSSKDPGCMKTADVLSSTPMPYQGNYSLRQPLAIHASSLVTLPKCATLAPSLQGPIRQPGVPGGSAPWQRAGKV